MLVPHERRSLQALVAKDREPITPFIAKVRALAARRVSTILVVGGCGDFFDVADTVIAADSFQYKVRWYDLQNNTLNAANTLAL